MNKTLRLILCVLLCFLPGILGSLATTPNIPEWYDLLNKPSFTPPGWLFGPVWTLLYVLMGVALFLVTAKKNKRSVQAAWFFVAHLFVNGLWSFVFFGFHQIEWALVVIALLWIMIVTSIVLFKRIDKRAAWLLAPYLLWVSFASVLNASLAFLN